MRAAARRPSWVWCPSCRRDLNGDALSFQTDDGDVAVYGCFTCGLVTEWLFSAPVPILLKVEPR